MNKTVKNKKQIEKKLHSIQKDYQNDNEAEDVEMIESEEKEKANEQVEELDGKEEVNLKNKNEHKKEKEQKIKNEIKEKHNKSKEKKRKDMKSAYDYELEVLNNHGIENDDFFIVE